MVEKRYLNLNEAQEMLPQVQKSLSKLMEINKALNVLKSMSIKYEDKYEDVYKEVVMNKKFFELNYLFFKELENLLNFGCIVKDLNIGLVDFFSRHRGKEIFLCWKIGEERITYWHEVGNSFTGRKPVSTLN